MKQNTYAMLVQTARGLKTGNTHLQWVAQQELKYTPKPTNQTQKWAYKID